MPRPDLSNEEYAALVAVNESESLYNAEQLAELRQLILATSFGQADPQFMYYRPYKPETLSEKLLCLADIGGFINGFHPWATESLLVLQEADLNGLPKDFETWQEGRRGFVKYIRTKLDDLSPKFTPEYYGKLVKQLDAVLLGVNTELQMYRNQFASVKANRITGLQEEYLF